LFPIFRAIEVVDGIALIFSSEHIDATTVVDGTFAGTMGRIVIGGQGMMATFSVVFWIFPIRNPYRKHKMENNTKRQNHHSILPCGEKSKA
jgi:hypothetical protein